MSHLTYHTFGQTDRGLVRDNNEDAFVVNDEIQLYAVADGLGGLPGGEVASQLAINELENIATSLPKEEPIEFKKVFSSITQTTRTKGQEVDAELGMATTLTAIKIVNDKFLLGHVGDSGLFLFKKDRRGKVTADHTIAQEMRDARKPGENPEIPEYYNHAITQCIGKSARDLNIQTTEEALESGDRLLLYTDGLTKAFKADELHELIFESEGPESFISKIIHQCNERGGIDNITAIAIFVE